MKILGIDIGTTTISGVVLEDGQTLASDTRKNGFFLENVPAWEKSQDVEKIMTQAFSMVEDFFAQYPDIEKIGVTGQMHGILYVDAAGNAVSPLYTWQDERGDLPSQENETWVSMLREKTGYFVATGYGLVTHAYNLANGFVPESAVTCCTIGDYLAMKLCDKKVPVMDASNAASLGFFDGKNRCFDKEAVKLAGIAPAFLPKLAEDSLVGMYREKVKVYAAIGDNQASFLGAMKGDLASMLVNVGTGSQFSVYTESYMTAEGLETRPMPGNGYLLVGASLCGGRAYALLENFFRKTARMLGVEMPNCYEAMNQLLVENEKPSDLPAVLPLFQGTRQDPGLTGSISGLTVENFTPLHLTWGMMEGMAGELNQMYQQYRKAGGEKKALIGSGNGLRKNKHLQKCFEDAFECALTLSDCMEEAATGAALYAAKN